MKYSKYVVELHYSDKQNDVSIFRTDTFFFTPTHEVESEYEKTEQKRIMKYISRFIRRPSTDGSIYIKQFLPDGLDKYQMPKFKYPSVAFLRVRDGAVMVKQWMENHDRYTSGDAYGPEGAISKLMELLEIY